MKKELLLVSMLLLTTVGSVFAVPLDRDNMVDTDKVYAWGGTVQFYQTWANRKAQINLAETDQVFVAWDKSYSDLIDKPTIIDWTLASQGVIDVTNYVDNNTQLSDAEVKIGYENNLDTNAYTDAEKTKLATVEARANHTGFQLASTVSDFDVEVTNNVSVASNTDKISYPSVDSTKVGFIGVTQAVDLDIIESDTNANNSKETNATHSGDATGSTSLTVVGINNTIMSTLGTGIVKNTTTTGIPSIAIAVDFPTLNQDTTGNASTATSATTAGTVTTAAQPTITSVGTLTSLAVTGTISGSNLSGTNTGDQTMPTQESLSVDDLITLSGVAEGSTSNGTFTGTTITDNSTTKVALQELEVALESTSGVEDGTAINDILQWTGTAWNAQSQINGLIDDDSTDTSHVLSASKIISMTEASYGYLITPPTYSNEPCVAGQTSFDGAGVTYECQANGDWNYRDVAGSWVDWNNPGGGCSANIGTESQNNQSGAGAEAYIMITKHTMGCYGDPTSINSIASAGDYRMVIYSANVTTGEPENLLYQSAVFNEVLGSPHNIKELISSLTLPQADFIWLGWSTSIGTYRYQIASVPDGTRYIGFGDTGSVPPDASSVMPVWNTAGDTNFPYQEAVHIQFVE